MTRLISHRPTLLHGSPYQSYVYAYPHKTAYRPLEAPVPLRELWSEERKSALFLYLHIPFCEMRCGFCNLFTQARAKGGTSEAYLTTLKNQGEHVSAALGEASFARLALGGGTPTFLSVAELESLFLLAQDLGAKSRLVPTSVETSPGTADPEKLALLKAWGVERISLGVQSFVETETTAVARPQPLEEVTAAIDRIRATQFPILNLDLIYGLPGQTVETWLASLQRALEWQPEELYLYPLYVRPLTGLGRSGRDWDDQRLDCYRAGRDYLLERGYVQVSMRMFRRGKGPSTAGPIYCCQADGMVGLGCGARSYARKLHYSDEYAVGARGVREILAAYIARPPASFSRAEFGFALDAEEQRRRWLLQALLQADGLDLLAYRQRFDTTVEADFPELVELEELSLATFTPDRLRLTPAGLERSDQIGPWLYSSPVRERMECYAWR